MVKNCDRGLENAARGRRPRAAFSGPRSQFFTIRTDPNSPWASTPKITLRYHSGGVMLPYIFENCNYSSFILSMIAMLNE